MTLNGPPVGPVIVPDVGALPSPQSIVAEYSLAVAVVSGSVKVATTPVNGAPSTELIVVRIAVIGASGAASDWKNTSGSGRPAGQVAFVIVFRLSPQR